MLCGPRDADEGGTYGQRNGARMRIFGAFIFYKNLRFIYRLYTNADLEKRRMTVVANEVCLIYTKHYLRTFEY